MADQNRLTFGKGREEDLFSNLTFRPGEFLVQQAASIVQLKVRLERKSRKCAVSHCGRL